MQVCTNVDVDVYYLIAYHHGSRLSCFLSEQTRRTELREFNQYHHRTEHKAHAKQGKLSISVHKSHFCRFLDCSRSACNCCTTNASQNQTAFCCKTNLMCVYVANECVKNRLAGQTHIYMRSISLAAIIFLSLSSSSYSPYIWYRPIFSALRIDPESRMFFLNWLAFHAHVLSDCVVYLSACLFDCWFICLFVHTCLLNVSFFLLVALRLLFLSLPVVAQFSPNY